MYKNSNIEICSKEAIHNQSVADVKAIFPETNDLEKLAEFYKGFADLTRIRILSALSIKEMCVCDLSNLLGMSISAISHQLKTLRYKELVKFRRQGKEVFYSLEDDHVINVLSQGLSHIKGKSND
ncbi:MAG: helix-turn-helix transcriptional regulator [Tenericutes bacterium]|nr:helix-turn-helix transcriptional regulator [Mycoplasmatota bacterium]